MSNPNDLHKKYCREGFNAQGILNSFEPVVPPGFNFAYDVVDVIADSEPERRAMVWCNTTGEERFFSYSDIKRGSNQAANLLISLGIKKGDKVMLVLKRHYQFWFVMMALHKIGATAVPGTNLLTKNDFVYRFNSAGITAVICTAENGVPDHIDEACEEYGNIKTKVLVRGKRDGWSDFDTELPKHPETFSRVDTSNTDALLLYFTSGTEGYPKMVYHDYTYPIAHIATAKYWHNLPSDGLHLTVSETGWAKSVWGKLYGQWFLGAAIFVYDMDKFDPSDLLGILTKYKITSFCAPPTIYRFLIKAGMEKYDLSALKYATVAGEALNPEVFNRFFDFTGLKLMEAFGQTETTVQVLNLPGTEPIPGSMGKPSPLYNIDIINENGESVPNGEVGEIVIRTTGPNQVGIFRGYYRDEERTNRVWHDNIYHTGDTAWRDENGYFWYVGRIDDIIKSSGYRIGPFEVESVLMEHPSVLECAVTGVPDDERGYVIKATIILAKGYEASDELKKELQDYVKKQTAPYKYPRIIDFVPELPKTISGKIRRVEIRGEDKGQK